MIYIVTEGVSKIESNIIILWTQKCQYIAKEIHLWRIGSMF